MVSVRLNRMARPKTRANRPLRRVGQRDQASIAASKVEEGMPERKHPTCSNKKAKASEAKKVIWDITLKGALSMILYSTTTTMEFMDIVEPHNPTRDLEANVIRSTHSKRPLPTMDAGCTPKVNLTIDDAFQMEDQVIAFCRVLQNEHTYQSTTTIAQSEEELHPLGCSSLRPKGKRPFGEHYTLNFSKYFSLTLVMEFETL
ncbi:hypothetical protein Scep_017284 [Stephania cephalantha]|uniref:Uncharacterized protein n=1 Tax=Stephania cephalantha TaxID=152367 RepID=A0AAP0IR12_9MAGN